MATILLLEDDPDLREVLRRRLLRLDMVCWRRGHWPKRNRLYAA